MGERENKIIIEAERLRGNNKNKTSMCYDCVVLRIRIYFTVFIVNNDRKHARETWVGEQAAFEILNFVDWASPTWSAASYEVSVQSVAIRCQYHLVLQPTNQRRDSIQKH